MRNGELEAALAEARRENEKLLKAVKTVYHKYKFEQWLNDLIEDALQSAEEHQT